MLTLLPYRGMYYHQGSSRLDSRASTTNRGGTGFSSTLAAKRCSLASYASGSINRAEDGPQAESTSGSNLDFISGDLRPDRHPLARKSAGQRTDLKYYRMANHFASQANTVLTSRYPSVDIHTRVVRARYDDFPHSIPYHGGVGLSSATRAFLSYQPVARSRHSAPPKACPTRPLRRKKTR